MKHWFTKEYWTGPDIPGLAWILLWVVMWFVSPPLIEYLTRP